MSLVDFIKQPGGLNGFISLIDGRVFVKGDQEALHADFMEFQNALKNAERAFIPDLEKYLVSKGYQEIEGLASKAFEKVLPTAVPVEQAPVEVPAPVEPVTLSQEPAAEKPTESPEESAPVEPIA